ncbi:hypothetical protein [Priestia aryabhattai]|uniref:hypothetical protein n=1 Tax=Priestia aryabhattai TaxID=412384 RepID=UPI0008DDC662|nr:hypothetical protein [Priestia aryabhattai]OHY73347.1 hypothetical protein BCV52_26920 [Priestia aryabhattai]
MKKAILVVVSTILILAIIVFGALFLLGYSFKSWGFISEDYEVEPPVLEILDKENDYTLRAVDYDWTDKNGEKGHMNLKDDEYDYANKGLTSFEVNSNSSLKLNQTIKKDDSIDEYKIYILKGKDNKEELPFENNSFRITDPGKYVIEVDIQSPNGKATYLGRVDVK